MIKHISFDFWDTLYKGNPNFRKSRANYLNERFGVTEDEVHLAVKKTKELCDGLSEKTMVCVGATIQAWHLLDNLGFPSIEEATALAHFTHNNFLENHPIPLFSVDDLLSLKDKGLSISIGCNTGLISGNAVTGMLYDTGVLRLFDFTLFSDRIGHFKPSPFFLQETLLNSGCEANSFQEILHVGDNPNTDGYMCQLTGTNFYNNPKGTLDFTQINNLL